MKSILGMTLILLLCAACDRKEKKTGVSSPASNSLVDSSQLHTYRLDTSQSIIYWVGTKSTGSFHNGSLKFLSGELLFNDSILFSGSVTADMHTLKVLDIVDTDENKDLETHLKDADFFDVSQFPTAHYRFNFAENHLHPDSLTTVHGVITIKDIAQPLVVKARIARAGNTVMISVPEFTVDRTQFGIMYKSQKLLDKVKDKFIRDEFGLNLKLIAHSSK